MAERNGYKSKSSSENEDFRNISTEGTAARTRPCSIQDIILKRYNKKLMNDTKQGIIKVKGDPGQVDSENMSSHSKHGAKYAHGKDTGFEFVRSKTKTAVREEAMQKDILIRKEEKHSSKNDSFVKKAEKDSHNAGMPSRIKVQKDKRNLKSVVEGIKAEIKEDKNEKRSHHRSRGPGDRKGGDYRAEDAERQVKDKKDRVKEKHTDKLKMEEREGKRKHEEERDDKGKMENDKVRKRKHEAKTHTTEKFDRRQDDDYLERKERWKESSHMSRYKELKSKHGKRSRSREHKKAKERGRSHSASPRLLKRHSSYHGRDRDHDRFSPRLSKERSERDLPDSERNGKDKNGASGPLGGHFKRYGGGTSGLGGYSPRQRRSETAVKTPSPRSHSPERKNPAWDLPPAGMDSEMVASMVAAYQASTQQTSASSNAPALSTVSLGTSTFQNSNVSASPLIPSLFQQANMAAVDAVQLTQATRPLRRLYVSNLPSSASDGELMEFLNASMLSANANHLPGTRPCISCVINEDKNHAFAEFLTPEDATAALALDGIALHGSMLKIKRPKDFVEPAGFRELLLWCRMEGLRKRHLWVRCCLVSLLTLLTRCPFLCIFCWISDSSSAGTCTRSKENNKRYHLCIFIGGISHTLSSDTVKEIVTAFGQLKAYLLEVNTKKKPPEAFAFLEYMDPSVTLKACAGLNGMRLGDGILTVVQATPDASGEAKDGCVPFCDIPDHAKTLLEKPTRVLELRNVLTKEELLLMSEAELEEVSEDVRLECTRFGTVKSVNIVKCNDRDNASIVTDVSQNHGGYVSSMQSVENGSLQKCLPLASDAQNCPGLLKEEHNGIVGDAEEDDMEAKVEIANLNSISKHPEAEEHHLESKLDENGSAYGSENNASGHSNQSIHEKREQGNSLESKEIACADRDLERKIIPESVGTVELDKNSVDEDSVQQGRHEGQDSTCLDSDNITSQIPVVANKDDGESLTDSEFLQVASVLIEFSREEASCQAAHTLHGRLYGSRKVIASYFPLSLYQKRFPRGASLR